MPLSNNTNAFEASEQDRERIEAMSHVEMAGLWRFSPPGTPYFDSRYEVCRLFSERFARLGGMTTAVSKRIGW